MIIIILSSPYAVFLGGVEIDDGMWLLTEGSNQGMRAQLLPRTRWNEAMLRQRDIDLDSYQPSYGNTGVMLARFRAVRIASVVSIV